MGSLLSLVLSFPFFIFFMYLCSLVLLSRFCSIRLTANNVEELSESDKSRQSDKSTLSSVHDSIKNEDSPQPPGIKKSKPGSENSVANESNRNGRSGASQVKVDHNSTKSKKVSVNISKYFFQVL